MKASVYYRFGPPEVLEIAEVDKPTPKENEVLIRIHAASATTADSAFVRGKPLAARLANGGFKPKQKVLGSELAGVVESVGGNVTQFKPGDRVVAASGASCGGHAEYISLPQDGAIAPMPDSVSYEEAVAVCEGGLTSAPFLREKGRIAVGMKVLVNGASGSVGTAAVQLAKYFGAEVTGVTSSANIQLVKSLGADHVIDYGREDFTRADEVYDIVFDTVGKSSFSRSKDALKPGGVYLNTVVGPRILLQTLWTSKFGRKRAVITFTGLRPAKERAKDLSLLMDLLASGRLKAVIDRTYGLEEAPAAYRYIETGHKKGNIVLTI
ncbi:MAG: NAD(P)-dependent alcohol dehydrogenase [Dehalococcoidia bacterium]